MSHKVMVRSLIGLALAAVVSVGLFAQETIVICHHPSPFEDPFGHAVTLTIPISALPAHLAHGDTIGACGSTPKPTPRPSPRPTPRPTPRSTPRATPRATPPARQSPLPSGGTLPNVTLPPTDT